MKAASTPKKPVTKKEVKENTFPVVAIGASAGGLEAMMELLKYLPADTGMAFIYVQHLSPDHKSMLTEILSKKTEMIVQEIDDMDLIQPNNVFVIPYNKGIEVTDGHIKLIPRTESGSAVSIDILFSTLAEAQKERVIGIILSGSASDGTLGMKAIKHEGGLTFAQDDTAKFTSMPHSAIASGMVDFILSPKEMALELARLSKHPFLNPPSGGRGAGVKNGEEDLIENSDPDLKIILNQLHKVTGVDFSVYKMNTIKRRIIRRMLLYKITQLKEYTKLLSQKKEEIDILYQDLLINVTSFFRDTETHKYLKETLFPKLLKRKTIGESLRIWVPACSTGEEVYSIAMMLLEIQESKATNIPVQIFATDLSEQAISKARIGIYTKYDLETVSPKRIQRFFNKADGGFRVNKVLRDMCVFAPHNILRDPPFSRLDFISCCNLFIYFDNPAQKKAVNTFHYALNEDGFLMLGKSENISHSANLFTGFNKKYKIFSRNSNSGIRTLPALLPRYAQQTVTEKNIPETNNTRTKRASKTFGAVNHNRLDNAIDAVLVSEFMPASVVINYQLDIVQFRGTTDLFLTHPKGKATFNILKMARPEIAFELRNTISKVIKTNQRIRKSGIELKVNSVVKIISLEIVPLEIDPMTIGWDEPLLLILFTEHEQTEIFSLQAKGGKNTPIAIGAAKDRRIKKLEQELAAAHADALAIAQDQEAFTEELQSANEEVVSSNEELQTLNEELETSKEEIESANEELTTTNQELQTRNDLLNEAYGYSEAVFATIHEPMLVLDKYLRVKSANKTFYKIFNVKEEETEGVLLYDLGNKQWNIPRLRELLEDLLPKNTHFHDFEIRHTFPSIGEKTMVLNARRIIQKTNHEELILLAISDITEQAAARRKIEESEKRYNMMLMQSPFGFAILKGKNMAITMANDTLKEIWGKGKDVEGKPLFDLLPELKDTLFPGLLGDVYTTGVPYQGNDLLAPLLRNGKLEDAYFNLVYQPYLEADESISGVTVIAYEVTAAVIVKQALEAQHEAEQKALKLVEETNARYYSMLMESPFAFSVMKGKDMVITLANDLIKEFWGKGNDVEGKTILEILPEIKDQPFPGMLDKVYTTGIPVSANEILGKVTYNGQIKHKYFNVVFQPYYEADNSISGVTQIAYEVTEMVMARKKIEESKEQFQAAIAAGEGVLWTNNAKGEMEGEQLGWVLLTGQTYEEYQGYGWTNAVHPDDTQPTIDGWNEAVKERKTFIFEHRVKRKDGQWRNFSIRAIPLLNVDGSLREWVGVHTDITERKQQQQILAENEQRLRLATQTSGVGIWEWNVITNKIRWDAQVFHIYGVIPTADGFVEYSTWSNALVPEDLADQERILQDTVRNLGSSKRSFKIIRASDGMLRDIETIETVRTNAEGNAEWVLGTNLDVTEKVLDRKKIEDSDKRYNMMVMNSPFAFAVLKGKDLVIELANDPIKEVWGRGNDIEGKSLLEIMPELKNTTFQDMLDEVRATGIPFHGVEVQSPKNMHGHIKEEYFFNFVFQPYLETDQTISGITIIGNEVTEQVIAKRKIEESEERFHSLADNVPIHIFIIEPNAEAAVSYFNKNWLGYTGQSFEEAIGNTWDDVIHPEDLPSIMDVYVPAFEKQQSYFLPAIRVRRHDGKYRWHSVQANPRYLPTGEFMGYIGVGFDIHEQKLAQDALKLSEEHFRLMADLMPAKISNASTKGDVTYFNKHWLDFSGYTFEELKDFGYHKIIHPDELEEFQQRWQKAQETGSDVVMEMRFKNKHGEYIWHLNIASPIKDENGGLKMWIGVTTEMHRQKEQREGLELAVAERTLELSTANEELIRMNKELEAFTYVSSHDLQEPLRKIRTISGRILEKENQNLSDSGKNYFHMMQNAAERMQTLIQDLLAFSHLSMADRKFETTDLNIIIEEVKKEFKDAIAEKNAVIEVKEICDVKIIPFQFRQLMHNLISNALKFSNPKIPPHIKISSVNITYSKINALNLTPHKEYCHISISDNGIGFEKEFAEKIFEVFQKLHCKDEYAGTGIGLAIVKKIVDNHNGIITPTSELHKGTIFDIYIPA